MSKRLLVILLPFLAFVLGFRSNWNAVCHCVQYESATLVKVPAKTDRIKLHAPLEHKAKHGIRIKAKEGTSALIGVIYEPLPRIVYPVNRQYRSFYKKIPLSSTPSSVYKRGPPVI